QPAVHEESVLGLAGSVGPFPADLQPDPATGRVAAAGAPVPGHAVGPHAASTVEHTPAGHDGLALAVDLDRATDRPGEILERVLEAAIAPRHDDGEDVVPADHFECGLDTLVLHDDPCPTAVVGERQWAAGRR